MVLRRPGSIHRKIAMNTNMERRKSKKFKLRMKEKRQRVGAQPKTVRIHPEDEGLITKKMVKSRTRKNPLANVKLSKKKRNKLLKMKRYAEKDQEEAAAAEIEELEQTMQVEVKPKKIKKSKKSEAEASMECE